MEGYVFMDEMEKALREELEKHLDTLRRNLEVVPMDVLKTKYKKPISGVEGKHLQSRYGVHPPCVSRGYSHQTKVWR